MSKFKSRVVAIKENKGVFVVFGLFVIFFLAASLRYDIAPSHSSSHCLHSKLFLVDRSSKKPLQRGQLVTFIQTIETKALPKATNEEWLKILVGLPGDVIKVTRETVEITTPSGEVFQRNLSADRLLETLKVNNQLDGEFERTITLAHDEVFLMGETEGSYDSRFWGPQSLNNITGTSYAIL